MGGRAELRWRKSVRRLVGRRSQKPEMRVAVGGIRIIIIITISTEDRPGGPWLRIHFPIQETWIRSLVTELRSHMLRGNEALKLQLERSPSTATS